LRIGRLFPIHNVYIEIKLVTLNLIFKRHSPLIYYKDTKTLFLIRYHLTNTSVPMTKDSFLDCLYQQMIYT
jgi:hypothetical protein